MSAMSLGSPLSGGMVYRGPMFVPGAGTAGSSVPAGTGTAGATQTGLAPTLATRAWGITAGPQGGGPKTAHYGVVGSAIIGAGLLVLVWYSLPR
jgi:hypothetical protein